MKTCCFIGYETVPEKQFETVYKACIKSAEEMIQRGVTQFLCRNGGGFDAIAACAVIYLRERYHGIRLFACLPSEDHLQYLSAKDKMIALFMQDCADDLQTYLTGAFPKNLQDCYPFMIDDSDYCICYKPSSFDRLGNIDDYMQERILTVNIAEEE